jgi:dCMP deaminase
LKLLISAGIQEIFYETPFNQGEKALVRDAFVQEGLVKLQAISPREEMSKKAALFLLGNDKSPSDMLCFLDHDQIT